MTSENYNAGIDVDKTSSKGNDSEKVNVQNVKLNSKDDQRIETIKLLKNQRKLKPIFALLDIKELEKMKEIFNDVVDDVLTNKKEKIQLEELRKEETKAVYEKLVKDGIDLDLLNALISKSKKV